MCSRDSSPFVMRAGCKERGAARGPNTWPVHLALRMLWFDFAIRLGSVCRMMYVARKVSLLHVPSGLRVHCPTALLLSPTALSLALSLLTRLCPQDPLGRRRLWALRLVRAAVSFGAGLACCGLARAGSSGQASAVALVSPTPAAVLRAMRGLAGAVRSSISASCLDRNASLSSASASGVSGQRASPACRGRGGGGGGEGVGGGEQGGHILRTSFCSRNTLVSKDATR